MAAHRRISSPTAAFWLGLLVMALAVSSFSAATPAAIAKGKYLPRHVIVELESEPLAHRFGPGLHEEQQRKRATLNEDSLELHATDRYARLVVENEEAKEHLNKLESERATFFTHLADALELSKEESDTGGVRQLVARSYNHDGQQAEAVFSTAFHGLGLRIAEQYQDQPEKFVRLLRSLPHVRSASLERRVVPKLFSSGAAINLNAAYAAESIGSLANAGKGIKIASVDSGVYAAAPMFNGTGYSYPPGWTDAKKGDVSNCNGKVIVSRVFSSVAGASSNPGLADKDSHGTFSASIAGGVVVNATRGSVTKQIHGVAPQAWIMNYRFGDDANDIHVIQALEAVLSDGADVVINSWAFPPYNYDDGPFSPIDRALVSLARAGLFVAMAAGNEGPFLSTVIHASDDYITVASITKESYLDTDSGQIVGERPYMVANTSCRGPSVLRTLKPDITAPGENVMAQGGGPDLARASAEFGVQSGTSFATPMVAGAAALMKQIWPGWTPKQIKAAFMASAKWKGVISNATGVAAQPLDMGAGTLDLAGAINPGALLDPPSLSFSYMTKGQQKTIQVTVSSVANTSQTYTVTSVFTGLGSASDYSTPVTGIVCSPTSITLAPGATAQISVTFDSSTSGVSTGDNQGFIVLNGSTYEVHMPLWARVLPPSTSSVLIINAMGTANSSSTILGLYTSALTALGYNSTIQEALATALSQADLWWISSYPLVFVLTGDNGVGEEEPQEIPEMTREVLREYVVMGGRLFLSGALAPVLARPLINGNKDTNLINFLVNSTLNSETCPSGAALPTVTFSGAAAGPKAFSKLAFTLLNAPSSRCVYSIHEDPAVLFPRELLPLVQTKEEVFVAGRRAQPTKQYPGRRFEFATVTSVLSLEMIPEASRVPFVAAVIGYLTEDINLSINVSSTGNTSSGLQLRLSLASSLSDSLTSRVAAPASLVPTYTITFGDSTSKTVNGPVQAMAVLEATHCYRTTGDYNVTVEAVSAFGTGAIWTERVSAVATGACGSASSLRAPLAFVMEWLQDRL